MDRATLFSTTSPVRAILHPVARNHKDARLELWHFKLPLPTQAANFGITTAGIYLEQRHGPQVLWKLSKELRLFIGRKRVGLPAI